MKNKRLLAVLVVFDAFVIMALLGWYYWPPVASTKQTGFDGNRALEDVNIQVGFGPRTPGSDAHKKTIDYILAELGRAGWQGRILAQEINGHTAYNILAFRGGNDPVILLGAHYDSRLQADNDPLLANHASPVPGANDGASGVAILLEIARSLPTDSVSIGLLFIDIEDNGHLPGWDWIQGSRAFARDMTFQPRAVVIVDMVGDADLNINMEKNSDLQLSKQIWDTARKLGYAKSFIAESKYSVLDDHVPFLAKGLRAVDIIDLDYLYWHTTQDTPDKVSASSLEQVGKTLLGWIHDFGPCLSRQDCPTN